MASGSIDDDWLVDFSTVCGAQINGLTRVTFYDPFDPERSCSKEFFLDGLTLEEIHWSKASEFTHQEVRRLENNEIADPGRLRKDNEAFGELLNIKPYV
ncbi:hypothetical protein [Vreelandella massiliensis]|uniref:hypothetical protein n=1 Tax=Vreelandella massiliensis TaxID=1816686 RepID=UPI00096A4089|nr:hypothetical protein [Halomonas massiliensis]